MKYKIMKKLNIYILLALFITMICSCEKQLSEPPKNEKVDKTIVLDEATAQIALNGAYYRFANISGDVTRWGDHQVLPGYLSGYLGYGFGAADMEQNINSGGLDGYWSECYSGLTAVNGVINGINNAPDNKFSGTKKNQLLGEALFLRAYHHFRLLVYFGLWYDTSSEYGVLLRTEHSTLGNISKKRSTVAESYASILEDLDFAIANAPAENPSWYGTRWAAMALKMRVLISRGSSSNYTEVISLADNIIQNGPYSLEDDVQEIFYSKGLNSNEVILGIMPQANQAAYYYSISNQYANGASSFYVAKKFLKDLLVNDPRESWLIGPDNPYAMYGSPDTYYFQKYIPALATPTQLSEVAYAFRLTEVYLLKSEAIIRSGGALDDARNIIKLIQSKGGVTDFSVIDNTLTADDLLVQNFYETVRSLVGEDGQDWMALMRLPLSVVSSIKPSITSNMQYYFPIPQSELLNNPLFGEQNPGYQSL
jgi:hypothetical protein